jgi:hypothetical protein
MPSPLRLVCVHDESHDAGGTHRCASKAFILALVKKLHTRLAKCNNAGSMYIEFGDAAHIQV